MTAAMGQLAYHEDELDDDNQIKYEVEDYGIYETVIRWIADHGTESDARDAMWRFYRMETLDVILRIRESQRKAAAESGPTEEGPVLESDDVLDLLTEFNQGVASNVRGCHGTTCSTDDHVGG